MSLHGKRVAILRAEEQSAEPIGLLQARGARGIAIPTIEIVRPTNPSALHAALTPSHLATADWVAFTSANGVLHTWNALAKDGRGAEAFAAARFAVVGSATEAALASHGATAHVVAKDFRGEGLAAAMAPLVKPGERVLLLRAQEASDVLPKALLAAGATVDDIAAYQTRACPEGVAQLATLLRRGELDVVVFSSGSNVTAVADEIPLLAAITVVCLGPVTAAAARARGIRVDVVPAVATFSAAIEALELYFQAI